MLGRTRMEGKSTSNHTSSLAVDREVNRISSKVCILIALMFLIPVWVLIGHRADSPLVIVSSAVLYAILVTASAIDVATFRLPNALTMPLLAVGLGLAAVESRDAFVLRALAAALGYGLFYSINRAYRQLKGRDGLGLGDAKLLAAAAAWVGLDGLASVLLLASLAGLLAAFALHLLRRDVRATTPLPFGPFIAFGTWIVWLFGPIMI